MANPIKTPNRGATSKGPRTKTHVSAGSGAPDTVKKNP
jgi:hypothetical protein